MALDPLSADVKLTEGLMAYYQRRYAEAEDILRRVLHMDPRYPAGYFVMGRINEAQGRLQDAKNMIERAISLSDVPHWRVEELRVLALSGDGAAARADLANLEAQLAREHRTLEPPYKAYVQLALGERSAALELLSSAVSERNPNVLWIAVDPRLDPLRGDARFQALIVRLGRP